MQTLSSADSLSGIQIAVPLSAQSNTKRIDATRPSTAMRGYHEQTRGRGRIRRERVPYSTRTCEDGSAKPKDGVRLDCDG